MTDDPGIEVYGQIVEFIQQHHNDRIEELIAGTYDRPVLDLSLRKLSHHYPDLYSDLINHPDTAREWFDQVATEFEATAEHVFEADTEHHTTLVSHPVPRDEDDEVAVSFVDPPELLTKDIGEPRGEMFGSVVAFEGICQQTSDPKPRILQATFECQRCGTCTSVDASDTFDLSNIAPPECVGCERQGPFQRVQSEGVGKEYQQVRVQEPPENARNASNPREIVCDALGRHLIDIAEPGDRVTVVGILREDMDSDSTLQDNRLEILSIIPEETEFDDIDLTDDDIEQIEELAGQPDLYDTLARSIAPSIYGYEEAKLAIAMQLFGGVTQHHYGNRKRGQMHVLLIGDPGTAKSNLLEYARSIAPRAVSSSGTAATSVGLTASAQKEKIGNEEQWTLQAGSLVLADQSVITIDEFDKFAEQQQRSVNQALSEGEIDIDKANVHATLKARCSALLAANPTDGRFNPYDSYADQFDMPEDLLSRCDLIFTFIDEPDEETDAEVATTILEPHATTDRAAADGGQAAAIDENGVVDPDLFQKYVAHARREYAPVLTEEASDHLHDFYTDCRGALSDKSSIGLNGRQLDALRRLTQAFARASLTDQATKEHAEAAIDLMMASLKQVVTDPEGDGFDIDRIETGAAAPSQQRRIQTTKDIVKELMPSDGTGGAPKGKILGRLGKEGIDQNRAEHALEKLSKKGKIYQPADGEYRLS